MIWVGIELAIGLLIGYILIVMAICVIGMVWTVLVAMFYAVAEPAKKIDRAAHELFDRPKNDPFILRFTGKPYGHPDHEGLDEELMDDDELIAFSQGHSRVS